jgi:glycosyltransferase involved in cell wall biosynthesis
MVHILSGLTPDVDLFIGGGSQNIKDNRIIYATTGDVGSGPSNARNIGLERASGDLIAVLDSDDFFHPYKLERCVPHALKHGFVLTGCEEIRLENNQPSVLRCSANFGESRILADIAADLWVIFCTPMITTSVHNRKKCSLSWEPKIQIAEDFLFVLGAFNFLNEIYACNDVLHYNACRSDSITRNPATSSRFVQFKHSLLKLIQDGSVQLKPSVRNELRRFIEISLNAEMEYQETSATKNHAFQGVLFKHILAQGIVIPESVMKTLA